jgi:hypothetical protein
MNAVKVEWVRLNRSEQSFDTPAASVHFLCYGVFVRKAISSIFTSEKQLAHYVVKL